MTGQWRRAGGPGIPGERLLQLHLLLRGQHPPAACVLTSLEGLAAAVLGRASGTRTQDPRASAGLAGCLQAGPLETKQGRPVSMGPQEWSPAFIRHTDLRASRDTFGGWCRQLRQNRLLSLRCLS